MAACTVCGKAEDACQLTNSKVPDRLRHPFTPGIDRNRLVAAPHELRQSPKRQQLRGWRDLVAEVMRPTHPTLDGLDQ